MKTEEELKKEIEELEGKLFFKKYEKLWNRLKNDEQKVVMKWVTENCNIVRKQERERAESIFDDIFLNSRGFETQIWELFGDKNQDLYDEMMDRLTNFFKRYKQKLKEKEKEE